MSDIQELMNAVREARRQAVRDFIEAVEREAEADMLNGNPIEGAHYRAMRKLAAQLDEADA